MTGDVSAIRGGGDTPRPASTLHDRLEQDRLRHRAARLDRVLTALHARARAYDRPPDALLTALSHFQEQLDTTRARLAANERSPSRVDGLE